MKQYILLAAAAVLIAPSCKKSSSSTPAPSSSIPSNGWKLGTTTYSTVLTNRLASINELSAFDGTPSGSTPAVNTLNVYFSALPSTGGTFHIVSYPATLASNEIGIAAATYSPGADYVTTGHDGIDATVTVTGGKIKVVIPSVWVKNTSAGDSLKLTGTLVEQ